MTTKKEKIRQLEKEIDDLKNALEARKGLTEQYRSYYNILIDAISFRDELISVYEEFIENDPGRIEEFRKLVKEKGIQIHWFHKGGS